MPLNRANIREKCPLANTRHMNKFELIRWRTNCLSNSFIPLYASIIDHVSFWILCLRGRGFESQCPNCSVWDGGQWRDSVSLARVDPALNGYLEKYGEDKQEGCAKAQDGCPPPPLHFLAEGKRNGDQHRR